MTFNGSFPPPRATPWAVVKINCPNRLNSGTEYLTGPVAHEAYGTIELARILSAVGYCDLGTPGCEISRLNRTAWYEEARDIAFATPRDLQAAADTHRHKISTDRIRDVPQAILRYLKASDDPTAPIVLHKKVDILELLQATPYPNEYPAMNDPKKAVEETLDMPTNLPALEAMPMKVVIVLFPNDTQEYHYFAPVDAVVGDHCVVYAKGANKNQGTFSIGHIERDSADLENRARSAILGTFNEEFAKHVQQRMDYLSAVKAKLQQKKRQFEETKFFEMMAESDPEAAELLKQLKQFRV